VGIVRNLSVRVPWHDRAWDGHVCTEPLGNSSCLALKLIKIAKGQGNGAGYDCLEELILPNAVSAATRYSVLVSIA
jgi:hypothetical protein